MGVSHGSFCSQIGKINFVYHEKSLISWALVTLESDPYYIVRDCVWVCVQHLVRVIQQTFVNHCCEEFCGLPVWHGEATLK